MSQERYQIMHRGRTTGAPLVRGTANKPENALMLAKGLEKDGQRQVQIHDMMTSKVYDVKSFGQEHRLK